MGSLDIPLGRHWTASNVAEHVRFRKLRPFFAFRSPERHLFVSFERIDLLTVHSHGQPLKQKTSADGEGPPVSSQGPGHFREAKKNKTKQKNNETTRSARLLFIQTRSSFRFSYTAVPRTKLGKNHFGGNKKKSQRKHSATHFHLVETANYQSIEVCHEKKLQNPVKLGRTMADESSGPFLMPTFFFCPFQSNQIKIKRRDESKAPPEQNRRKENGGVTQRRTFSK